MFKIDEKEEDNKTKESAEGEQQQMVLGHTYCPPTPMNDLNFSGSQQQTSAQMSAIPVNGSRTAGPMSAQRAMGGSSATGSSATTANPFSSSQAADQQFSSSAAQNYNNTCPSTDFPNNNQEQPPQVVIRQRPQVPPKPQIDIVRYVSQTIF